ncbi:MAG: hypothetical protein QXO29_07570 [Nitrososphaerota archaeon]
MFSNKFFIAIIVLMILSFFIFYNFGSSGYLNSMTAAYGMVWSLVFLIVMLSLLILRTPIRLEKIRKLKIKKS